MSFPRLRLAAAVFLLCTLAPAFALDLQLLKPEGYVSDFARAVDPAAKTRLERFATSLQAKTGVEIAFVTLATLDGEPIEDVANKLFGAWGIGSRRSKEGLLLLLAIHDRRSRLEVGYGLEPVLPDGFAGSVLRAMRPALREQAYGDALLLGAASIGRRILEAKGLLPDTLEQPETVRHYGGESPGVPLLPLLAVLAIALYLANASGGRGGFPPVFPGPRGGVWRGGWGDGGGFGGGSGGGGGFGGFGGGSSGGGGASSNW